MVDVVITGRYSDGRRLTYGGHEPIVRGVAVVSTSGYNRGFKDVIWAGLGVDQPGWDQ